MSNGERRGVAILGSTGSIGTTALRVLDRQQDRFRVAALTAFNNAALLAQQVEQFKPGFVGIVRNGIDQSSGWQVGADCLVDAARRDDGAAFASQTSVGRLFAAIE